MQIALSSNTLERYNDGVSPTYRQTQRQCVHCTCRIALAQVFDALRYYAEHQPEINQYIQANRVPESLAHPAVQQRKLAA